MQDSNPEEGCTLTHVVELDELIELTSRTGASKGTSPSAAADYERFSKLVCVMVKPYNVISQRIQAGLRLPIITTITIDTIRHHPTPSPKHQLARYQEQPSLLDPHLEQLMEPLATALQSITLAMSSTGHTDVQAVQAVCQMIWRLCNTRYVVRCTMCIVCICMGACHDVCMQVVDCT